MDVCVRGVVVYGLCEGWWCIDVCVGVVVYGCVCESGGGGWMCVFLGGGEEGVYVWVWTGCEQ